MHRIPCIVRMQDGASFSPGTVVHFGLKVFIIKHVFISRDLLKCTLMVVDASSIENRSNLTSIDEEVMLNLDEVIPIPSWKISQTIFDSAKIIANNSFSEIFCSICHYPPHLQRAVRKFCLVSKLRTTVNYFLTGLEMVGNYNLGLLDWSLDPKILQISSLRPKLVYRIEDAQFDEDRTDQEVDRLLGTKWDIVDLAPTMDSFRIILTLEIQTNCQGELILVVHAGTCHEVPEMDGCYRSQYLRYSSSHQDRGESN